MAKDTGSKSQKTDIIWKKNCEGLVSVRVRSASKSGPLASFLFISDVHYDSPHCDRDLLKHDLDVASKNHAKIISLGDFFDVMQTRNDPRRRNSESKKEYSKDNYLGEVLKDSVSFMSRYDLILAGDGNHEDTVLKSSGLDLTQAMIDSINLTRPDECKALKIGYGGFIAFSVEYDQKTHFRYIVAHHHGFGGGGSNKGVAQFNQRMMSFEADAHIMGHVHQSTRHTEKKHVVSRDLSRIEEIDIDMIRISGYKPEHRDYNSWGSQKGYRPNPSGSWMLQFFRSSRTSDKPDGIYPVWTEMKDFVIRSRS